MRVLLVNHTAHVSGGERSLLSLIDGLAQTDVECQLACPDDGPLGGLARDRGVVTVPIVGTAGSLKPHPVRTPVALGEMTAAGWQVARRARAFGAQVIHANSIRASMVAGPAARVSHAAAVAHLRDRLPPGAASTASLRLVGATCTEIVANSRYTAEGLATAGIEREAIVVHNPIDTSLFRPLAEADRAAARAALDLTPDHFTLGVVGQITPWKGQDTAIEALALLADRRPTDRLLLVGEAKFVSAATRFDNRTYLAGLHALAEQPALQGRVAFLGEREDMGTLMPALDVLLVPSWEEPFGRVVVEAMASGTPVIATAVGGPAEIIRDGVDGLLVPPQDPAAWAAAVQRLADDAQLRGALAAAGRQRSQDFTVGVHARAMVDVYRRAARAATTKAA